MMNSTVTNILSDSTNFNLGIFGIAVTIFTVLYAFILSKRDNLVELNDKIKAGDDSPLMIQRTAAFARRIEAWKKLNYHIRVIIVISIVFFLFGIIIKNLCQTQGVIIISKILKTQ